MHSNKIGFGGKKIPNNYDHSVINRVVDVIKIDDSISIEINHGGDGYSITPNFNYDLIDKLEDSDSYKVWSRLCKRLSLDFNLLVYSRVSRYKKLKYYTDKGYNGKYCINCFYITIWLNTNIKDADIINNINKVIEGK